MSSMAWRFDGSAIATMSVEPAREIALAAKRLRQEGFGTATIKKGLTHAKDASTFEKVVRGEVLGGVSNEAVRVPTYEVPLVS